jgi:hypothetical protein
VAVKRFMEVAFLKCENAKINTKRNCAVFHKYNRNRVFCKHRWEAAAAAKRPSNKKKLEILGPASCLLPGGTVNLE